MPDSQIVPYHRPVFPPPGHDQNLPQVINVGGQLYQIQPIENRSSFGIWPYIALAVSGGLLSGAVAVVISNSQQVIQPTQPVVIEQPVPIPTTIKPHCIAFCGSDN